MKFPAPDNVGQVLAVKPGGDNPIEGGRLLQAAAAERGSCSEWQCALPTALPTALPARWCLKSVMKTVTLKMFVQLTDAQLGKLFPAYLLLDKNFCLAGSGPSIRKLLPGLQIGHAFDDYFDAMEKGDLEKIVAIKTKIGHGGLFHAADEGEITMG